MSHIAITSISPQRRLCGVSRYAERIEEGLRNLGVDVLASRAGPFGVRRLQGSSTVLHVEIAEDLKRLRTLAYQGALAATAREGARAVAILHTVLGDGDLARLPGPARRVALGMQWGAFGRIRRSAHLVVLSDLAHERLRAHGFASIVVPHGAPESCASAFEHRAEHKRRLPAGKIAVGIVGHPYAAKRQALAVRAFSALPQAYRSRAVFAVIGGDSNRGSADRRNLLVELRRLPADQIFITGPLENSEYEAFLDELDIALLPYANLGGASGAYWDLLARGVALLCSDAQAFEDASQTGAAITVRDWTNGTVDHLAELIKDSDLRRRLGVKAREYARRHPIADVAKTIFQLVS